MVRDRQVVRSEILALEGLVHGEAQGRRAGSEDDAVLLEPDQEVEVDQLMVEGHDLAEPAQAAKRGLVIGATHDGRGRDLHGRVRW